MSAKSKKTPAPDDSFGLKAFRQPAEDAGLSIDKLSAAFAEMLSTGDDPYAELSRRHGRQTTRTTRGFAPAAQPDRFRRRRRPARPTPAKSRPAPILEAMLFVGGAGNQPLESQQVARLMRGVRPAEIDALVRQLNADYDARRCPYTIAAEGAGYRLRLRDQHARLRDKFYGKARQARLSQAAIEVLVAGGLQPAALGRRGQPLRGTPSGAILTQLVRRQLLQIEREPGERRPLSHHRSISRSVRPGKSDRLAAQSTIWSDLKSQAARPDRCSQPP